MRQSLLVALCAVSLIPCEAHALATISATSITSNSTWGPTGSPADDSILVAPASGSTLTISGGAILTIQPGTVVLFATGKSLVIGSSTAGSLSAVGSPAQPIEFSSNNGLVGGWAGLDFADNSDLGGAVSTLAYCSIRRGGSAGYQMRLTSTNGVTLSNCTIADYSGIGLVLSNASLATSGSSFHSDVGTFPISGYLPDVAPVVAASTLLPRLDGKYNGIQLRGSTIAASLTLPKPPSGFCYITASTEDIEVNGAANPVLTIADGTLLKLNSTFIQTGVSQGGGLRAHGVVFTSFKDDTLGDTDGGGASVGSPAQWEALRFSAGTLDAQTVVDSCMIRYGGQNFDGGVVINSSEPTITRCVIELNNTKGLRVETSDVTGAGIHDNLLRNNVTYSISAPAQAMVALVPNNSCLLSGSGKYNGYELRGSTIAASLTLPKPPSGFCYVTASTEDIEVNGAANPVLTIADGTLLKLNSTFIQTGVSQGGGLRAHGVVFTSFKDDTLGDTDGGGASVGSPAQWEALRFSAGTLDAQTVVDSCMIRYGGQNFDGGVVINSSEPTITRCVIELNNTKGLRVETSDVTGAGIHDNLLRNNVTYSISAPAQAMVALVPNNSCLLSGSGKYNGYELRGSTIAASLTLPKPPSGFCYVTASTEDIEVNGAANPVLTIADGTLLKLNSTFIQTGVSQGGGLRAHGVVFTSFKDDTLGDTDGGGASVGSPAQWEALRFSAGTLDAQTVVDSCMIRYGGQNFDGGVVINSSEPTITRCVIELNNTKGLRVETSDVTGAGIHDNLLRNNVTYSISAPAQAMVALVPNNSCLLSGSGKYNGYELRGSTIAASLTLPKPPSGFCYVTASTEDIEVNGAANPVLTIADGTLLKLNSTFIQTGVSQGGGLRAHGVVFTSFKDDTLGDTDGGGASVGSPAQWEALRFSAGTLDAQTVVDSCMIRYGGQNFDGGVVINSSEPTITRCVIELNNTKGLRVETSDVTAARIHDNLFRNNTAQEISAPMVALAHLVPTNKVQLSTDGRYNAYDVRGGTVNTSVTFPAGTPPLAYVFPENITIPAGVTVSFGVGNTLKFGLGISLTVSGTLLTDGEVTAKPYSLTVFTSVRDDAWWGDSNGDGTSTLPADGNWGRIELRGAGNASRLRGVAFSFGGSGGVGQVYINGTGTQAAPNVLVRECHFTSGLQRGGVYAVGSNARIDSCGFFGPTTMLGVANGTATISLEAPYCWWGDPTGPFDPSVVDPCTNPSGLGVGVSDYVNYCPWSVGEVPVTDVDPPAGGAPKPTRTAWVGSWPNPARNAVLFSVDLAGDAPGRFEIFDMGGRRVRALSLDGAGFGRKVGWDLRGANGQLVAPGVYHVRFSHGGIRETRRIVVLR